MDIILINDRQITPTQELPPASPANGFLWLDAIHDEVSADSDGWRDAVERATGTHIYDLHLLDIANLGHPSFFDATRDYEMVVFRKLALAGGTEDNDAASEPGGHGQAPDSHRKIPPALQKLATVPVTFLLVNRALVTVHARGSRTIEAMRNRLLEYRHRSDDNTHWGKPPTSPEDLMLRLLNAMVDQYLELRHPLTAQLDRWQRALLNPRRPFNDWAALLDARNELHKLERMCEEQHDALQELRDHFIDTFDGDDANRAKDLLLVRINDVMEHINRVLTHARRLESSLESAVQIHFAAMSHRTSEIMRTLTVITALFMPLTLITGIFGMNFPDMPLVEGKSGFWLVVAAMGIIVAALLFLFWHRRYLEN
ncbi:MAG TPA: magnesium transporter CorA family protein [Burkholderiaceae bacterium]|jgi:Mg2+ and Co2+ transporter CorA|nr:magnesium transporter CorA family protein [Burkholderiaceae bacterium]